MATEGSAQNRPPADSAAALLYRDFLSLPLPPGTRALFAWSNPERFARLSDEELGAHITRVRDLAYARTPWPCLGRFSFIDPGIRTAAGPETYAHVLQRLRPRPPPQRSAKVLDLGCCVAQDARALVMDGTPAENVVASDLLQHFIDLGFELFADKEGQGRIAGMKFQTADVFNQSDVNKLKEFAAAEGGYDVIYVGSFIHLFGHEYQLKVAHVLSSLLSRAPGSLIFGRQVGVDEAHERERPPGVGDSAEATRTPYRHSPTSFRELFELQTREEQERVGGGEALRGWDVNASLGQWVRPALDDDDSRYKSWSGDVRMLSFVVTRK